MQTELIKLEASFTTALTQSHSWQLVTVLGLAGSLLSKKLGCVADQKKNSILQTFRFPCVVKPFVTFFSAFKWTREADIRVRTTSY